MPNKNAMPINMVVTPVNRISHGIDSKIFSDQKHINDIPFCKNLIDNVMRKRCATIFELIWKFP